MSGKETSLCIYKDPSRHVEVRIKDLLARMTLKEKAAQMLTVEKPAANPSNLKKLCIGGIYVAPESIYPENPATAEDWANMVDEMQKAAMSSRLGIPVMYACDAVHGHGNVYGATIFPHNVGLGASRDTDLVQRIGAATALEAKATGVHSIYSPVVAVVRDLRWGRCYESFSEDTEIVTSMSSVLLGLQGTPPDDHPKGHPFVAGKSKIIGCANHFVGDGGPELGLMEGNTKSSLADLERIHLKPFLYCLSQGVSTIMASYTSWNGVRMHCHHFLLTNMLKDKLGFKGYVVADWEGIDTICEPYRSDYRYCVAASINAGLDMVLEPFRYEEFLDTLISLVDSGYICMARIDDAVERILRVKFVSGLFDHPFAERSSLGFVGCKAHRELAREAVRKSLVLLKNGKDKMKPLLPLDGNARRILVAGLHADDLGYQCGGWTITKYGTSGRITIGTTIWDAIKESVGEDTEVVYEPNPSLDTVENQDFSYAIIVVGEPAYAESRGYNTELQIPFNGIGIIDLVAERVPSLVIMISGRPLVLEPDILTKIDALVAAWLPGSEARGITDVIFGDFDFQGQLPVTWFKKVDQLPMNHGDPHYDPLFPLGFGLRMKNYSE